MKKVNLQILLTDGCVSEWTVSWWYFRLVLHIYVWSHLLHLNPALPFLSWHPFTCKSLKWRLWNVLNQIGQNCSFSSSLWAKISCALPRKLFRVMPLKRPSLSLYIFLTILIEVLVVGQFSCPPTLSFKNATSLSWSGEILHYHSQILSERIDLKKWKKGIWKTILTLINHFSYFSTMKKPFNFARVDLLCQN